MAKFGHFCPPRTRVLGNRQDFARTHGTVFFSEYCKWLCERQEIKKRPFLTHQATAE